VTAPPTLTAHDLSLIGFALQHTRNGYITLPPDQAVRNMTMFAQVHDKVSAILSHAAGEAGAMLPKRADEVVMVMAKQETQA